VNLKEAYAELGLSEGASEEDVKRAFKKMAAKYHPDVNKTEGSEDKFKRINEAKRVIDNPPKENFNPFSGFGGGFGVDFNNFMVRKTMVPKRRPSANYNLYITFAESVLGCKKTISYDRYIKCNSCVGNGLIKDDKNKCTNCDGRGETIRQSGNTVIRMTCNSCKGKGFIGSDCSTCDGFGTVKSNVKDVMINIPPGITTGTTGMESAGNFIGTVQMNGNIHDNYDNLYINVFVEPDSEMSLDEEGNVVSEINISLLDALKGTVKEVNTVKGKLKLKIPNKVKNNQKIEAKNYGIGGEGSHLFNINVNYPEEVDNLISYLEGL
jgi:molecular chaperone DnaJ